MNFNGFYFITDSRLSRQGIVRDVEDAIRGGATIIQYREKEKDTGPMIEEAREIKGVCRGKAAFLINDRVDVCLAVDADGLHLGQTDMGYKDARRLLGDKIIGITVHNLKEAKAAEAMGADYVGVSPIFETKTKADAGPAAGLETLKEIAQNLAIPVVAIGGITLENAKSVMEAGATTLCAMSATIGEDVGRRVRAFTNIINASK